MKVYEANEDTQSNKATGKKARLLKLRKGKIHGFLL